MDSEQLGALICHELAVRPEWLDYNGHMNVAYYTLAFDQGGERLVEAVGMGERYTAASHNSWMVLEAHITYQQEAHRGDRLQITNRVLDFDHKRLHLYQEMLRGTDLLATQEQMVLHVDLRRRRSAPFEPQVLEAIRRLHSTHRGLDRPEWIGRVIGIANARPAG